jgi:hypothetical protein
MKATDRKLKQAVKAIPINGEWWDSGSEEMFRDLASQLTENGFTLEDAIELLMAAYGAVAAEFGD